MKQPDFISVTEVVTFNGQSTSDCLHSMIDWLATQDEDDFDINVIAINYDQFDDIYRLSFPTTYLADTKLTDLTGP